ncbi:hypothetical protein ISCGN_015797 [Ixodes scapularis]
MGTTVVMNLAAWNASSDWARGAVLASEPVGGLSMIGVAGSRHLARGRRGSSPSLSPLPGGPRRFSLSPLPQEEHAASAPESPASRASPVASVSPAGPDAASPERKLSLAAVAAAATASAGGPSSTASCSPRPPTTRRRRAPSRLSTELPAGVMLGRRRAVTTTDHKTCALLHTRLKGLRLEDIA